MILNPVVGKHYLPQVPVASQPQNANFFLLFRPVGYDPVSVVRLANSGFHYEPTLKLSSCTVKGYGAAAATATANTKYEYMSLILYSYSITYVLCMEND